MSGACDNSADSGISSGTVQISAPGISLGRQDKSGAIPENVGFSDLTPVTIDLPTLVQSLFTL
jgi:hypothetical protein